MLSKVLSSGAITAKDQVFFLIKFTFKLRDNAHKYIAQR